MVYTVRVTENKCLLLLGLLLVHGTCSRKWNPILINDHQLDDAVGLGSEGCLNDDASSEIWVPTLLHVDHLHVITTFWLAQITVKSVLLITGGIGHLEGHLVTHTSLNKVLNLLAFAAGMFIPYNVATQLVQ